MRPVSYDEARQILIWTVGFSYVLMVLCLVDTKVSLDYEQAARAYVVAAIPVPAMLYAYWRRMLPIDAVLDTLSRVLGYSLLRQAALRDFRAPHAEPAITVHPSSTARQEAEGLRREAAW